MTKVIIYQCNFGKWDMPHIKNLHVKQSYPHDYVYYDHDEENLFPIPQHLAVWPFCVMAKAYRMFPNKCKKLQGYDLVIHLDAQDQIIHSDFVKEIVESEIMNYPVGFSMHGDRNCPYAELNICRNIGKYVQDGEEALTSRIEKYKKEGMPENLGLYWDGFIVYNMHNFQEKLAEVWWNEVLETNCSWPCSQGCLIYALWKTGVKPKVFPREYGLNHYFIVNNHKHTYPRELWPPGFIQDW